MTHKILTHKNLINILLILPTLTTSFQHKLSPITTFDKQFYDTIEPHGADLYLDSFINDSPSAKQNKVALPSFCEKSRMHEKTGTSKIVRIDFTGKDQLLHRSEELVSTKQTKRYVVKYEQFEFIVKIKGNRGKRDFQRIVKVLWNDGSLVKRTESYRRKYEKRVQGKKWVECQKNPVIVVRREENY